MSLEVFPSRPRTSVRFLSRLRSIFWQTGWLAVGCLVSPLAGLAIEKDVVVSVYQGNCAEGDFEANLETAKRITAQAVERGSHFVLFPECFLSGYADRQTVERGARGLDDPKLLAWIADSKTHDTAILVGMARRIGRNKLANTQLIIHRGRIVGWYDKVMLTWSDRHTLGFETGTSIPVFQLHGVKFAIQICHDTSFPYASMLAQLQGAELLFTPDNNLIDAPFAESHQRWVRNCHIGLACQMHMVVARSNTVANDVPGQVGYGDSFVLDPQGTPIVEAELGQTVLLTATIQPSMYRPPVVWSAPQESPQWLRSQLAAGLTEARTPRDESELRSWLENMAIHHRYTPAEMSDVLGMTLDEIHPALLRMQLHQPKPPAPREKNAPLRTLPYPGGRHPRIGFLDGAMMPQRETKVSVFTPWDDSSYVVVDVPEAIFSNLGLIYLAHTHVPTLWDLQGIRLPKLEWTRLASGALEMERRLPNGIAYGATVLPTKDSVRMELRLTNGTDSRLTGLRVQNCVMLAHAKGFEQQSNDNKRFPAPFAVARNDAGDRWIITAWTPSQRCWGNPPCPCLHADPQFPDCEPGETVRVDGWLSFYQGTDIETELKRIADVLAQPDASQPDR
jgi:predicted amidohydrolase